jgi:hypothetical protein
MPLSIPLFIYKSIPGVLIMPLVLPHSECYVCDHNPLCGISIAVMITL